MELLIPHEQYLEAGVHIGTRIITREMKGFVYRYRKDKLCMLNVEQINNRLVQAGKFLAKHDPSKIAIIASRVYAIPAAKKFAEITGAKLYDGRFIPGTFTNPQQDDFFEPSIVIVCDPRIEKQALREATELGIQTLALVDTDNNSKYLDFFIPCNNKGRRSVPAIIYLLTREYLKNREIIKSDKEFNYPISDFKLGEIEVKETEEEWMESREQKEEKIEAKEEKIEAKEEKIEAKEEKTEAEEKMKAEEKIEAKKVEKGKKKEKNQEEEKEDNQ